ncbi:NACHT domain-containing protein [Actinomadura livida]|uniref:NACHT domain-containing protein n=1 Tax=Actinomadura livida TaxID=79909 RepID=A0A7W7MUR3_9ACTN|nr:MULTISPECIES: NACHT domain-containing protein [Actinomadura]MBB4771816.1 hypothetical protein [Actinomadura catellatispora]GGU02652.1 hypothetical protein GCM10010208_28390 [Actinomadura livida]
MGGERWAEQALKLLGTVLLVAAAAVAVFGVRKAEWGGVDPGALVIALLALLFGVAAFWQGFKAQRITDTDVDVWTPRLAGMVRTTETKQRWHLLGGQDRVIDVGFSFTPSPAHDAADACPTGTLADVVEYFERLSPQRLVITGEGGAGKTVLANELILGWLDETRRRSGDPVPVRIPAAGWDTDASVAEWLTAHLVRTYGMRKATAHALVDAGRVIPVIDGLDEMDKEPEPKYASRAGRALQALNAYQQGREKARLVLTCRTAHYDSLIRGNIWARDAARITLAPVTPDQAWRFIEAVAGTHQHVRWQPVLDALTQPDHPLASVLATPLWLTVAITVYQELDDATGDYLRDPADLADPAAHPHPDEIRDHLRSRFIHAAVKASARNPAEGTAPMARHHRYPPEQVHSALALLARYLNTNIGRTQFAGRTMSGTDLVLHELWPMAGQRARILACALPATVAGMTVGVWAILTKRPSAIAVVPALMLVLAFIAWLRPWPKPARIHLRWHHLRKTSALPLLVFMLIAGINLAVRARSGDAGDIGTALACVSMLTILFLHRLTRPDTERPVDPRRLVRDDLWTWLALALAVGVMTGLPFGLVVASTTGPPGGLTAGLVTGVLATVVQLTLGLLGVGPGAAAMRYLVLVLCLRGRTPWQLGRFLDWCYSVGLLRVAGIAYQFRHQEFQIYLARHPSSRRHDADRASGA